MSESNNIGDITVAANKKAKWSLIFMGIGMVLFITIIPSIVMFILSIVKGAQSLKMKAGNAGAIVAIILSSISLAGEIFIVLPVFIMSLVNYINML